MAEGWISEFKQGICDPIDMEKRQWVTHEELKVLEGLREQFDFRVPARFFDEIGQNNVSLTRQFVPSAEELNFDESELRDPIGDQNWSPVEGIVHRYPDRVLLMPTYVCASYCRFCFRRYKVSDASQNLKADALSAALEYIKVHQGIREVILTGGDPLTLSDSRLLKIAAKIRQIPHVELLRIHTRIPTTLPSRITATLIAALKSCGKAVWLVAHVNAADELNTLSQGAFTRLVDAGIPLLSQTVLLKGINDSTDQLMSLFQALVRLRVKPYYLHYPDLAQGTHHFRIPLERAIEIYGSLRGQLSGFAIPEFVVDIPGGQGKISVDVNRAKQISAETWEFQSPLTGKLTRVTYPILTEIS